MFFLLDSVRSVFSRINENLITYFVLVYSIGLLMLGFFLVGSTLRKVEREKSVLKHKYIKE